MITSLQEITERFEKIKNHKPKASKKLNELGDILASAYRLDAELASQMWQYIVDLNTTDNIANSKFYVAQVFNKISDRLSPEEATSLITMFPERVRLLVLYGYNGFKLWNCLDTLVHGYIKTNSVDAAIICIDYFYEKFGGIHSDRTEIYRIARKATLICVEYLKSGQYAKAAGQLANLLSNSENQDVNLIVEITRNVGISGECEDYDMLFYVTKKCKEPVEFFDLLWDARGQFSLEELRNRWVEYIEECEENDVRPHNYIHEDESKENIAYEESKLYFYVELAKKEDILLDYYFNKAELYDVEKGIIYSWVFDENWGYFVKYISQVILVSTDIGRALKDTLKDFMDACFYSDSWNPIDRYGRSYKELMESRSKAFANALAQISATTIGCSSHRGYHLFIKEFIEKLFGTVEILNNVGFEEEVEKRSAIVQLKSYIKFFNKTQQGDHDKETTEFTLIMNKFANNAFSEPGVTKSRDESYQMASDDTIATFFFTQCPREFMRRRNMLSSCIIKNDVNRAIELIDMMASTVEKPGYSEANGWGRQNMLTIKYLIELYDYNAKQNTISKQAIEINDEMRQTVNQLVERIMPFLPLNAQDELKDDLYRIRCEDNYIA